MAEIGQAVFRTFIFAQGIAILLLTPALVAGVVAEEKRRKTLHYLLASRLTSGEIILGKLAARLLHVGVFLAIGLPIISLLSLFGGVDPKFVVLGFRGDDDHVVLPGHTGDPGLDPVAAAARGDHAGLHPRAGLALPALDLPVRPADGGPVLEQVHEVINSVNEWIAPSSPFHLLFLNGPMGVRGPNALLDALAWMMGLQTAYGTLFVMLAIARLRPGFRNETDSRRWLGRLERAMRGRRFLPRPACGDDAMLWKERYVSRSSTLTKVASALVFLVAGSLVAYYTYDFAVPAFQRSA